MQAAIVKVLFLQEQPEVLELLKEPEGVNPGVGGTSYMTSQVAYQLHCLTKTRNQEIDIYLGCQETLLNNFHGVPIIELKNNPVAINWDVVIATGGYLDLLSNRKLHLRHKRLIAWLKHPFDYDRIGKARALTGEILSTGNAQYFSNSLIAGQHHQINDLFYSDRIKCAANNVPDILKAVARKRSVNTLRIGYMGGLIPSKGFHQLAEQWTTIKQALRHVGFEAKLEVIGGSSLYKFNQGHSYLPCDKAYGDRLLSLLGDEVEKSVHFHGTLGSDRYSLMSTCDLAVLNPSGEGEAFPATVLEWLSLGVPVVGSLNYGCSDAMQFFPSLTLNSDTELPNIIALFAQQSDKYKNQLRLYCEEVSQTFSSRNTYILEQWTLLITKPYSNVYINNLLPIAAIKCLLSNYISHNFNRGKGSLRRFLFGK